jgi:hypothetical protein
MDKPELVLRKVPELLKTPMLSGPDYESLLLENSYMLRNY